MPPERRDALLAFIALGDRLKHILRAGRTGDRRENSAEHAWHVALIAVTLADEVSPKPDVASVLAMIAIHDVVEIEAGDTFAFDDAGLVTQAERERAAADRIFGMLPDELGRKLRGSWDEFEALETPEARFAMGCDRLQGFLQQIECGAPAWAEVGLTKSRSLVRMQPAIDLGGPFAAMIEALYERAMAEGLLLP
ncbi:MAG: 5-nucleotidase [Rubritepida sp.]|nr:5-nucleotidase [Rubritepida sp.]